MELEKILKNTKDESFDFRAVYDLTIDQVFSYVFLRTGDKDFSKDICQDIYVSLWVSLPKFKYISDGHFYSFLFTVVRRKLWKARIKNIKMFSLEKFHDFIEQFDDEITKKENTDLVLRGVMSLTEKDGMVIKLRYFSDMSFSEISKILNITENNAKVINHRALKKLKQRLSSI